MRLLRPQIVLQLSCRGITRSSRSKEADTRAMLDRMIRVDHAGEFGADRIYAGQHAVLKNTEVGDLIQHMWDQEKHHLATFNKLIPTTRSRPTALLPIWQVAGYALGAGTALLGKEAAMACTVAVETSITEHYNDQIRQLANTDPETHRELIETITKFRDEEQEHHDIGLENDAELAPAYQFEMAPNKKGLSLEDKRKRMMEIFYETKDVFLLKDMEKIAPKSKGITPMSVKDVLTSLVDDGLVDTDKIGTSVYFWGFPSKASQARKRKLETAEDSLLKLKSKLTTLEKDVSMAEHGREASDEREELLRSLEEEKKAELQLSSRLKEFSENDPAVLEEMAREAGTALEAANRWTDNVFSIQSWIKKKFPAVDTSSLNKQFGIPEDLDYIE